MTQSSPIGVFDIKNCNTIKKARTWLAQQNIDYICHDSKQEGVSCELLQNWEYHVSWETVVNKKWLTWRRLPRADKTDIDSVKAFSLMQLHTSLIKRPVLQISAQIQGSFDALSWQNLLA